MAERRIINGFIVERAQDGTLTTIGPANAGPQMPADPTAPYQGPKAGADLTGTTLTNQGKVYENQLDAATIEANIRRARAEADKAEADAITAKAQAEAKKNAQARRGDNNPADKLAGIIKSIDNIAIDAKDNGGFGETGYFGSLLRGRAGTAAYDIQRKIDKIDANSAFSELQQMRENSPTGGALGGIAVEELKMLKSTVASLDPNMSQEEFLAQLQSARDHYAGLVGKIDPANKYAAPIDYTNDDQLSAIAKGKNPEVAARINQSADQSNRDEVLFGQPPSDAVNGGYVPYGGKTREEPNPQFKGMNEAVKGMIVAGRPAQEIKAFLNSKGIAGDAAKGIDEAAAYYRKTGKTNFGVSVENMSVPMTGMQQFRNNAPQTRVGTGLATAANAGGFGIPQMIAGGQGLDYLRSLNPKSALVGDVAGTIGATAAIGKTGAAITGKVAPGLLGGGKRAALGRQAATDATYGGIYGATTEGKPLSGALTAAAGSVGGQVVGKGFQKGFQGVSDPAVQYLTSRNIPLTMGQTLGNRGIVGKTMNKLESVPILGEMLGARRADSLQAFEREALKDVVSPVGGNITAGGRQGVLQAQDAVSQGYRDALSGVNVSPDQQFIQDAQAAMQAGGAVPKFGEDFTYAMNQEVGPLFGQSGNLSGPELQSALQSIGKIKSGFDKNSDAMAGYAGKAAGQMDDAISGMVGRQAPDVMPAYNNAKSAYSNLVPFENARIGAVNQDAITPAQLQRAVTNNTKKFGGRGAAASGKNLTDLMEYGQKVLPESAPNPSGTASHLLLSAALPTALGGTAYGVSDMSPESAGVLATLAAMSTKAGQKAVQAALVKRPDSVRRVGGLFGRRKAQQLLAGAGSGAALSYFGE